jgi:hypothetical protein
MEPPIRAMTNYKLLLLFVLNIKKLVTINLN